jgi:hypothetical protein
LRVRGLGVDFFRLLGFRVSGLGEQVAPLFLILASLPDSQHRVEGLGVRG